MGIVMLASLVTFQLAVHVVTEGETPAQTPAWVATQVANANTYFAPVDAAFELVSTDPLPASDAHIVTRAERDALEMQVTDHKIHVFVITKLENVDDPKVPVHGVTWHGKHSKYIIIAADSMDRVLAHELGHVFGLAHSTYKISIMNKTKRDEPPPDQRRFADEELAAMRPVVGKLAKVLAIGREGAATPAKR